MLRPVGLISRHSGKLEFTIFIGQLLFWFVAIPEVRTHASSCEDSISCFRGSWTSASAALKGRCFCSKNFVAEIVQSHGVLFIGLLRQVGDWSFRFVVFVFRFILAAVLFLAMLQCHRW